MERIATRRLPTSATFTNSRTADGWLAEPCSVRPATSFGSRLPEDLQLRRRIGRGYRPEVYEARYRGQPIALKVYSRACQERCRRRSGVSAAQFECTCNLQFGNIAVIDRDGEWIPKLFDFNLIPRNLTFPRPPQFLASLTGNAFFAWRDRCWLRRISQASHRPAARLASGAG
jgi:hypothetical protein